MQSTPQYQLANSEKDKPREASFERSAVMTRIVVTESFEHGNIFSYSNRSKKTNHLLLIILRHQKSRRP
jgi:hypothetical protein